MWVENSQKEACLERRKTLVLCDKVDSICERNQPSSPLGPRRVFSEDICWPQRNLQDSRLNKYVDSVDGGSLPNWEYEQQKLVQTNVPWGKPAASAAEDQIYNSPSYSPTTGHQSQSQIEYLKVYQMNSSPPESTSPEPSTGARQEIQKLEKKLEKLTLEKNTLEKEKRQLQLKVDDMRLKNRNFQNREHSSDEAMRGEVKALQGEIERLKRQGQGVLEEKAASELELSGLKKRMISSPPESTSLEASKGAWQEMQEKLEKLTLEKKTLEKEKHKLQLNVNDMGLKIKNFQKGEQSYNEAIQFKGKAVAEIGILKGQVKIMDGKMEEKAVELSRLQKRLAEQHDKILEKDKEIRLKEIKIQQMEGELGWRDEELQKSQRKSEEESRRKEKTIHDLTKRLSDEMGTKVAADESSLENISIRDRPMNIASEYELLCSNQWLTAKTELDELLPKAQEEEKMKFLCGILVTGLAEGEKLKKTMLCDIGRTLQKPGVYTHGDTDTTMALGLPEKLMQNLLDLERQTVDGTDLSVLCENIEKEVKTKASCTFDKPVMNSDGVRTYLQAAAVITWKMMLQRPLMSFRQDGLGDKWQGEKQDVYWSSADPSTPGSTVKYYVHPALYHGEAMMVKGRVFLSKEN